MSSLVDPKNHSFSYPVFCFASGDKVHLRVMLTSFSEYVELPENVNNLSIFHEHEKQEGLIFCSGMSSFSLYVISYQLHNISYDLQSISNLSYSSIRSKPS